MNSVQTIAGVTTPPPAFSLAHTLEKLGALKGETLTLTRHLLDVYPCDDTTAVACVALLLEAQTKGHTCHSAEELSDAIARAQSDADARAASRGIPSTTLLVEGDIPSAEAIRAAFEQATNVVTIWSPSLEGKLPATPVLQIGERYYAQRFAAVETTVARHLLRRLQAAKATNAAPPERIAQLLQALPASMHDRQRDAAERALQSNFMLLTGGPGTGKTWTVRNILSAMIADALNTGQRPPHIELAAPTGKAAARMIEALTKDLDAFIAETGDALVHSNPERRRQLHEALLTLRASTLHRLLGIPFPGQRPQTNPHRTIVPADVVVVDEVSMLDATAMARLFKALGPRTRLFLIGDPHQLASVDAGSVLADLVSLCRFVPSFQSALVELTKSSRFTDDSLIGRLARETNDGVMRSPQEWRSVMHLMDDESLTPPHVIAKLAEHYLPLLEAAALPTTDDEALAKEARDTCAQAALKALGRFQVLCALRQGDRSVLALNQAILAHLVGQGRLPRAAGIYGPGIPILILQNDYTNGLFNGDIGVVMARDAVAFAREDGGIRWIHPSHLPRHQAAFAFTIHKSQGSEWDEVAIVLPRHESRVLTRQLLYTAVSRAKSTVRIYASEAIVRYAIAHDAPRATGLQTLTTMLLHEP